MLDFICGIERVTVAGTLSVVLLLALLFAPLLLYLLFGWRARRREIIDLFPSPAVALYYKTYFAAGEIKGDTREYFIKDFDQRYGRRHYIVPALLLAGVSTFLAVLCVNSAAHNFPEGASVTLAGFVLPRVAIACVAGAYVWIVWDFILRERSLDFSTTHVNSASFRLATAVPVAFIVPSMWGETGQMVAAFLLGAFPTSQLMAILRRTAGEKLGVANTPEDKPIKLENLRSVDSTSADRFREEGIMTIAQLSNADPIALTIRSGYPFGFVLDCICEAVAWCYLGQKAIAVVEVSALPGALDIYGLIAELDYVDGSSPDKDERYRKDRALADETLVRVAGKLETEKGALERILRSIFEDSRVTFFAKLMEAIANLRSEWQGGRATGGGTARNSAPDGTGGARPEETAATGT